MLNLYVTFWYVCLASVKELCMVVESLHSVKNWMWSMVFCLIRGPVDNNGRVTFWSTSAIILCSCSPTVSFNFLYLILSEQTRYELKPKLPELDEVPNKLPIVKTVWKLAISVNCKNIKMLEILITITKAMARIIKMRVHIDLMVLHAVLEESLTSSTHYFYI